MSPGGTNQPHRPFLLYCPSFGKRLVGDYFGADRMFDVAIHDYSGDVYAGPKEAEYQFAGPSHKWPAIDRNLHAIGKEYQYYAFFDDDIVVSTAQINELFTTGQRDDLGLFQAALSPASVGTYFFLFKKKQMEGTSRAVPLVEIMMPVFSRSTLEECRGTFGMSESGWGLDLLWREYASPLSVVDGVVVGHAAPVTSSSWVLSSGLKPIEEKHRILAENDLRELDERFLGGPLGWRLGQWALKFFYRIERTWLRRKSVESRDG
ncbi:MAG: hypothetical protein P8Q97_06430 [Myxococcota bacterium]|nr:hypothetical protein [Myxococcota bacterium]